MSSPEESPAVPAEETGGNERLGFFLAGGLLLALGWGVGVGLNLWAHIAARSSGGTPLGPWTIGPVLGAYGWAVVLLGWLAGTMGVAILALGLRSPKGRFVLPGYGY